MTENDVVLVNCAACGKEMLGGSMTAFGKDELPEKYRNHEVICGRYGESALPFCGRCYHNKAVRDSAYGKRNAKMTDGVRNANGRR